MRTVTIAMLAAVSLLLAGCTAITRDLRYPGGYPGSELDKRTFDASRSKQLQLFRGLIVLAMAARIGEANVSTEEAEPFAQHLATAAKEINLAAGNLPFEGNPVCYVGVDQAAAQALAAEQTCSGYPVNFEVDVSRVEARVVRAMIAALPTERVKSFLEDVSKGNLLSAALGAARAFGNAAGSFHRAAGVHRSALEIVGVQLCGLAEDAVNVTQAYEECLGIPADELFFNARKTGREPYGGTVRPAAFHALMRVVRSACVGLPLSNELTEEDLTKVRDARRQTCAGMKFEPTRRADQVPPKKKQEDQALPSGVVGN